MQYLDAADLPQLLKKRHKYGAQRVLVDGITFASQREADRWKVLRILEARGIITDLRRQVPYKLVMPTKYVADFVYRDQLLETVVEDVKGYRTERYKRLKRLMRQQWGIEIREV